MKINQLERITKQRRLERRVWDICDRYYSTEIKDIVHFFDCHIFAARRTFCSCGLIHDLEYLDYCLARVLYKKFDEDLYKHEGGRKRKLSKKSKQCALK
jgi:hypothetical protein